MKTLPIGIQSFSKLINENKIYIDKTKYIHELIKNGSIFFLSRPRRFGKSLLVSTFEELFKGNNSLFKGLYIYEKWNWEEKHPVIHLDFAEMNYSNSQELKTELLEFISETAEQYAIELKTTNLASRFAQLIRQLHITTGKQVVILVDEYDKPVTDNLSNKEVLSENKRILHDFYQVIKATDEHLKFVFLTGVSKFSGLSVFSALNSINDITVDNRYSAICGYTQEELEENFKDYIIALSKELGLTHEETIDSVREWYNGYSWDAKILIYNPFSTLMLFDKKRFDNYWFRTGTPTFLLNLIHKHNRPQNFLGAMTASGSSFESYNPDNLNEIPLLFQTGYLTIKNIKSTRDGVEYTLDFPDREVRDSFLQYLLSEYTAYPKESMPELFKELSNKFQNYDVKGLQDSLTALLAHIPYQVREESEAYYHSIFLVWLKTLGFDIRGEISTNNDRIDAVLKHNNFVVIAEIKYGIAKQPEEMLEAALKQIDDKKYLGKEIILLGIAFNGKAVKCKFGKLDSK